MNQDEIERQVLSMKGETVIFPKAGDYAIKSPNGTISMCTELPYVQRQIQLVDILCRLTEAGRATWLRRRVDIEFLYCFAEHEHLIVELTEHPDDGENETLLNLGSIRDSESFTLHYRGESLLYLGGLHNGDKLLRLIRSINIPADDNRWEAFNAEWEEHLLDPLIAMDSDSL
ncbi:MAG: hypothetical protein AAFQ95_23110 [Cyanobacteria bacterium J06621_3]